LVSAHNTHRWAMPKPHSPNSGSPNSDTATAVGNYYAFRSLTSLILDIQSILRGTRLPILQNTIISSATTTRIAFSFVNCQSRCQHSMFLSAEWCALTRCVARGTPFWSCLNVSCLTPVHFSLLRFMLTEDDRKGPIGEPDQPMFQLEGSLSEKRRHIRCRMYHLHYMTIRM